MYPGPSKYYFNDSAGIDVDYEPRRDPRAVPSRQEHRPRYAEDDYDATAERRYQEHQLRPSRGRTGPRAQSAGRSQLSDRFPDPGTIKYRKAEIPSSRWAGKDDSSVSPYKGSRGGGGGSGERRGDRGRGGAGGSRQRPRSAAAPGREPSLGGAGTGASLRAIGSERSFAAHSERSFESLRSEDKQFDRYLRIREGTFDLGPSEGYKRPVYNALLDPLMGEYFDRARRRSHLVKSKLVNEFGELNDDRKWKELHYQEVRREKEAAKEFEHEIREELSERRKAVKIQQNRSIEERRLHRIHEIREDQRERVNRIRQTAMKRLEKYSGPGNFWLAYKAASAFSSLLRKKDGGGSKPWEEPDWEDRAARMIQNCWRGKLARRVMAEKKQEKEKKERRDNDMKARAAAAAAAAGKSNPAAPPTLVSRGSFRKNEAFKAGSASKLKLDPPRTASGRLLGLGDAAQGGRALEDMSPLEAFTLEDRRAIVKIQAAARARRARGEVAAMRREKVRNDD